MMRSLAKLGPALVVMMVLGGCSGGDASSEDAQGAGPGASGATSGAGGAPGTGGGGSGGFENPAGETITLELEAFDVQPGTERQVCKTINLPADVPFDVVRFHSTMLGTSHHFNAYKVLGSNASDPVSGGDSTVHDCAPAEEQLSGEAAYIFGAATPERILETPAGVAFHLEPGQRIILEQHVINATAEVIQGGVTFELLGAAVDAKIEHHADIIWFANWAFGVLPNQESSATTHCTVPYDVEVFGLMSHTHKLGKHFSIEKWVDGATTHLYDSEDWAHPKYLELAPTLALAEGEGLEWTCTWANPTSDFVGPGKESTDEMCMTFAAAYPKGALSGEPIQCN